MEFLHDIDDELVRYLKNRFQRWRYVSQTVDGVPRVKVEMTDEPIPVFFKLSHAHEKNKITEEIFTPEQGDTHLPAIVVEPRPIENMDRERPFPNYDWTYNPEDQTGTIYHGKRRLKFIYQIEGVSRRWTDHQLLKPLIEFRLFERSGIQNYVSLFGRTYTVTYETPQLVVEEERNLFRIVSVAAIEIDVYTLPEEVIESVESVIINWEEDD